MTWPTVPIVTTAMDAGTDTPPRDQIKAMADAVNDMILTPPAGGSGRLIGVQVFDTVGSFTYTPTAGAGSVIVDVVGGGGGAGGRNSTAAGQVALSGAGAGGARAVVRYDGGIVSAAVIVGANGVGGSSGGGTGTSGGASSLTFTGGRGAVTCGGGGGAFGGAASGTFPRAEYQGSTGGSATITSSGSSQTIAKFNGGDSGLCVALSATCAVVGGAGAPDQVTMPDNGGSGVIWGRWLDSPGYGGGGAGSANCQSLAAAAGANGKHGRVIIWEYA